MANESMISLNVNLGSTKDVEARFNALVKTLETKKIKLEVDTSSLQASLKLASSEIEKAYSKVKDTVKRTNEEIAKPVKNNNSGISELEKQISSAEKAISKFTDTKNKQLNNILAGNNGTTIPNLKEYETLVSKMNELKNMKLDSTNVATYATNVKGVQTAYDELTTKIKQVNSISREMNSSVKMDSDIVNKVRNYNTQLEVMRQKNADIVNNPIYQQIANDVNKLSQASQPLRQLSNETNTIDNNMKQLRSSMTQVGNMSNVFTRLGQSIKSAFSFMSASMVFYQFANQIRDIPTLVTNVNTSLVELNKVANLSENQLNSFLQTAYKVGEGLGRTGSQVTDATTEFVKAGYDLAQSTKYAESAMLSMNVGSGMNDMEQATNSLIATLKGFEMTDGVKVIDSMAKVADSTAIGYSELADGIERVSAVMNQGGTSFEQTLGLLTSTYELSRNIEKSATGINTISQRMRGLKIGDSGELEKDSELIGKVEEKLRSIAGVELMGDDGQLRSTFDVLQDLSKVYGTLTTNQKQYLTEVLAGNRQNTVLAQIMQNWEAVDKSIQSSTESTGYAEEVNKRYLDSINGRIASLKSAWEQLATTTLSSDTIKGFVSGLTKIVEFMDAIGGLVPILASVVLSMTALKVISASQSLTFGGLAQGAKSLISSLFTVKTATDAATVSTLALSAAEKTLVIGAVVAGVMAIGAGIHYVATSSERAAQKVSNLTDELNKIKETSDSLKGLADEFEKLSKKSELNSEESERFYEVQNQIKELQPSISGYYDEQGNFIITQVSSAEELLKIQKEILETKKEELRNAQEDTLEDNIKKYEKQKQLIEDIARYSELSSKGKKISASEGIEVSGLGNKITMNGGSVSDLDGTIKDIKSKMAEASTEIHDYLINSLTLDDAWDSLGESMKNGIRKTLSEMDTEEINDFSSKIKDGGLSISDFIGEMSKISTPVEATANALGDVSDTSSETGESVKSLSERVSESADKLDILKVALSELESIQDISGTTLDKLIKKYPELEDKLTDTSTAFDVINGKILEQSFDSATDDIASLTSVLEDLQAGNGLTAASFKKISDNFPELLAYMNDEASLTDAISEKMDELKETQSDAYRQMLLNSQDYYNANIRGNEQMSNSIFSNVQDLFKNLGLAYNGDLQNWKSLAQGKAEIETQLINQLNTAWESHFGNLRTSFTKLSSNSIVEKGTFDRESYAKKSLLTDSTFSSDKTILDMAEKSFYNQESEWIKEKAKMQQEMYNVSKLFDDITFDPIDIKVGGTKSSGGSKSSSENYAEYIDSLYDSILQSLQDGTEKVDRQIAISQSKLENIELFGTSEDETKASSNIEKLYQDRIDIMKKSSEQMVYLRNKMAKELQATGYEEIKGLDLTNISQLGVDKVLAKLEKQIDSANNSNDKKLAASLTYKKDLIEDYTGNIINANSEINSMAKDIIDAQNELADTVIENINKILDHTISKADSALGRIDLEKMLLDTDGDSDVAKADSLKLVELNKQALTQIVTQRKATEDAINKLRLQGVNDESEEIQSLLDQWAGYESSRLSMIKEIAQARRESEIDSAQDEMDGIQEAVDDGESLLDLTVDMLKKETEAKKDALKEQTDDRKDALKEQYDEEKKALEDRLDLLKEEADAQKDALKEEQDERNYSDEVSEKQKQIANVQSKITELSLDDSTSAQKKRKELEDELTGYKKELANLQDDRSIELQTNAIDRELEAQEEKINKELEALETQYNEEIELIEERYDKQIKEYEDYLDKEARLKQEANDLIESNDKAFYERLKAYATEYGSQTKIEFENLWDSAYDGMEKYGNGQLSVISNIESMTERIISLREEIESLNKSSYKDFIEDDAGTDDDDYEVSNGSSGSGSSLGGVKYDGLESKDERAEYRDKQLEKMIDLGDQMNATKDTSKIKSLKSQQESIAQTIGAYNQGGTWYIMINNKKYPVRSAVGVRHNGGFMDESSVNLKSNEMFGKLLKNEFVVNEGQMDRFMTKTLPSIANYKGGGSSTESVVIDIHDFSVTKDTMPDFEKLMKTEVPKILNDTLFKKGIK